MSRYPQDYRDLFFHPGLQCRQYGIVMYGYQASPVVKFDCGGVYDLKQCDRESANPWPDTE